MAFENAALRIQLKSPVYAHGSIPSRRMTLDGLLAGMVYARTGDGPGALASLHELLAHARIGDEHIPQASQIIFLDREMQGESRHTIYRSPMRYLDDPVLRNAIVGFKDGNAVGTVLRPYKGGMMNNYSRIEAGVVYFLLRGDLSRIEDIIRRAGRIGALRAKGGGEIDQIGIDAMPARNRMFGIVCGGKLMRPIPVRLEGELLNKTEVAYRKGAVEAWRAPYHWAENREPCLVPIQFGMDMALELKAIRALSS